MRTGRIRYGLRAASRRHVLDLAAPDVATALGHHHDTSVRSTVEAGTTWAGYAPGRQT